MPTGIHIHTPILNINNNVQFSQTAQQVQVWSVIDHLTSPLLECTNIRSVLLPIIGLSPFRFFFVCCTVIYVVTSVCFLSLSVRSDDNNKYPYYYSV